MRTLLTLALIVTCALPVAAAEHYKDVPKEHWAAESVKAVTDAGIMNGYPDGTFQGDRPVTRYELAVALQAMVQYIQESEKPLVDPKADKPKSDKPAAAKPDAPKTNAPKPATTAAAGVSAPKVHWADAAKDFLKKGGFLPEDSPVLQEGNKPVSSKELGNALSSVALKLMEDRIPPDPVETVN